MSFATVSAFCRQGDILKCILALSENDVAARRILLKRIKGVDASEHTAGNLLLLSLEKVYGDYLKAVDALGQILSIKGKVIPVTLAQSSLCCKYEDGSEAIGEVNVDKGIREGNDVESLFLKPPVPSSPEALMEISQADAFCIGPGSFYTSILPNFLPAGVSQAIGNSRSPIIYICNLFTEGAGMKDYSIHTMIQKIESYIGRPIDHIIMNDSIPADSRLEKYEAESKKPILMTKEFDNDPRFIAADLWQDAAIARHDPRRLANLIFAALRAF
ncbi:MAG: 2-phospho-L-lactate transferase CofD family protein [Patescibacteria group bacterium]